MNLGGLHTSVYFFDTHGIGLNFVPIVQLIYCIYIEIRKSKNLL